MVGKALVINVSKETFHIEDTNGSIIGPVSWGLHCHLVKYRSYDYSIFDEHNVLCLGAGLLSWSEISGTRRLVFTFRSPLWGGFFLSSMGGAAYVFRYLGVDYAAIEGKAKEPAIILMKSEPSGEIKIRFEHLAEEKLIEIFKKYKESCGGFALAHYIVDNYSDFYGKVPVRIITVGPASVYTRNGALMSYASRDFNFKGKPVEYSARGGPGSVLYRAHKVAAIVYGGSYVKKHKFPKTDLSNFKVLNNVFQKLLGNPMNTVLMNATVKYRYDPKTKSGGTFGNNYAYYNGLNPTFNWSYIYWSEEERKKFFKEVINEVYVKPFNELSIAKRLWRTCDEPCVAVCKKMYKGYKIDYEPYCASTANTGVLDLDVAVEVVDVIDAMGYDAIEFGNTVSWILEAVHRNLIPVEALGLKSKPYFDHKLYYDLTKVKELSQHNAEIVKTIAWKLAFGAGEAYKVIGEGIRRAAKKLDEMFEENVRRENLKFEDIAIYVPFGPDGSLTPAMYWGPGNIMPLPIIGKYLTYYHGIFMEPEDLAVKAIRRAFKELYSEEGGLCRFHRGWGEKILPKLIEEAYGIEVNMDEHNKELLRRIVEYDKKAGYKPVFWESKRIIDYFTLAAKEYGAEKWYEKLIKEGVEAAKEYWQRFLWKEEEIIGIKWDIKIQ